jgi:hypothetical protein
MPSSPLSDQVRGKTISLSWTDGPTKGTTQEHIFHEDGTVEWHSTGKGVKVKADQPGEKPHYSAEKITDDVCVVSYLSESGYTLTVSLNFYDDSAFAIASNEKTWAPVHGTFEVAD